MNFNMNLHQWTLGLILFPLRFLSMHTQIRDHLYHPFYHLYNNDYSKIATQVKLSELPGKHTCPLWVLSFALLTVYSKLTWLFDMQIGISTAACLSGFLSPILSFVYFLNFSIVFFRFSSLSNNLISIWLWYLRVWKSRRGLLTMAAQLMTLSIEYLKIYKY